MKYNDIEKWNELKSDKQKQINQMDFSQMNKLHGRLGNKEVRLWYKSQDEKIPGAIDPAKLLKEQAVQAFDLRNEHRSQARILMKDEESRDMLNQSHKNPTFEEILEHKKKKYGLSDDEVYHDIIRSSATTNKEFDQVAGVNEKEGSR